jgi:hypothetical protein
MRTDTAGVRLDRGNCSGLENEQSCGSADRPLRRLEPLLALATAADRLAPRCSELSFPRPPRGLGDLDLGDRLARALASGLAGYPPVSTGTSSMF